MKKLLCLILSLLMLLPTLSACSKAPEYAEIEARLKELVEASAEINRIFFGEGLPTYVRVEDPKSSVKVHRAPDPEQEGKELLTYYYEVVDERYEGVIAYRASALPTIPYSYLEVSSKPDGSREALFVNEKKGLWYYPLENYTEPTYEFFYDDADPAEYDYVRLDSKYLSIDQMKAAAEQVYSTGYLESIYSSLFVGTVGATGSVVGLSARYIDYASTEDGTVSLMKSNTYEPLITETRQFDFSTARIVKPSNGDYVNVTVDSYLPSNPSAITNVRISLILQDGAWMLDSATY